MVYDTIRFVKDILDTEMNSATDNPMVLADKVPPHEIRNTDVMANPAILFRAKAKVVSGGNFHGEYPAKAADYLAIAVHELASISERRIERLVNPALSNQLPAFLVRAQLFPCVFPFRG